MRNVAGWSTRKTTAIEPQKVRLRTFEQPDEWFEPYDYGQEKEVRALSFVAACVGWTLVGMEKVFSFCLSVSAKGLVWTMCKAGQVAKHVLWDAWTDSRTKPPRRDMGLFKEVPRKDRQTPSVSVHVEANVYVNQNPWT